MKKMRSSVVHCGILAIPGYIVFLYIMKSSLDKHGNNESWVKFIYFLRENCLTCLNWRQNQTLSTCIYPDIRYINVIDNLIINKIIIL